MTPSPISSPLYFSVFRAIHRGGLGLWLNRHTLLPMTAVPIIVTFLTLMVVRANIQDIETITPFTMALIQIPADFVTGIFCALIIFIIMNAPSKEDKDAPVMFTLNIVERKDLLVGGALAHVIIGYLASGIYGGLELFVNYTKQNASITQGEQAMGMIYIIPILALMLIVIYGLRFLVLPVLLVGDIDSVSFFKKFKRINLSFPIFTVKMIIGLVSGIIVLLISGLIGNGTNENSSLLTIQMALMDATTSVVSVLGTAWSYAALSVGIRQMLEKKRGKE